MVDRVATPMIAPIGDLNRHDYQNKNTERFDKSVSQGLVIENKQRSKNEDFTEHLNKSEIQFVEKQSTSLVYDTAAETQKMSPYL